MRIGNYSNALTNEQTIDSHAGYSSLSFSSVRVGSGADVFFTI